MTSLNHFRRPIAAVISSDTQHVTATVNSLRQTGIPLIGPEDADAQFPGSLQTDQQLRGMNSSPAPGSQ